MDTRKKKIEKNVKVREVPHNPELEKEVLGAIISDNDVAIDLFSLLKEEDFYEVRNQKLFDRLKNRFVDGLGCDFTTIVATLKEDEKDEFGGVAYLNEVLNYYYSSATVLNNAQELKKLKKLRDIIHATDELQNSALNREDAQTILGEAIMKLDEISKSEDSKDFENAYNAVESVLDDISEAFRRGVPSEGVSTGFKYLDSKIHGGFMPGQMIVLAARPGGGKTGYAMNIVANIARRDKDKVIAVFNLEMSSKELMKRMLATYTNVKSDQINEAYNLTKQAFDELMASKKLFNGNLFIDDTADISIQDISLKLKRLKAKVGRLDLVVIDHMQLIAPPEEQKGVNVSRYLLLTDISRRIKIIAKELNVPVLVLSQMSRSVEKDENPNSSQIPRKSKMSDLRESGAIEQDADLIMFIEKAEFAVEEGSVPRIVSIVKNRNGESDVDLNYAWELGAMTFHEKEIAYKAKKKEDISQENQKVEDNQDTIYSSDINQDGTYSGEYAQDYSQNGPLMDELEQDVPDYNPSLDPEN